METLICEPSFFYCCFLEIKNACSGGVELLLVLLCFPEAFPQFHPVCIQDCSWKDFE